MFLRLSSRCGLSSIALLTLSSLSNAETACLYQEPLSAQVSSNPVFQLIAQFPGETIARSSLPFTTNFRSGVAGYRDRPFNITTQNRSLQMQRDDKMKASRWEVFGTALALTEISEIAIVVNIITGSAALRSFCSIC